MKFRTLSGAFGGAALALAMVNVGLAAPKATCDRQLVMQIDSAMVSVDGGNVTVSAFGVAESAGWDRPRLVLGELKGDTATVDFSACRPEVSAQVLTPIQVRETLETGVAVRTIVVRTKTNSMTIEITR